MRIILLLPDPLAAEERALHTWLHQQSGPRAGVHPLQEFRGSPCDVLWVHSGSLVVPSGATLDMLRAQRPGAGFLFTGGAALLPHQLGWDLAPFVAVRRWCAAEDELFRPDADTEPPRLRGHAGFRAHPLLAAMHGGVYTWAPSEGEPFVSVRYRLPHWPRRARVIATERVYSDVQHEYATIWEYDDDAGPRALCIGAYFPFAPRDRSLQRQHEQLARAALRHLELRPKQPGSCWQVPGSTTRPDPSLPLPHVGAERPGQLAMAESALGLPGGGTDDPFTLAGRRACATGTECGGVHELWVHPVRALRALQVTGSEPVATAISPLGIERTFTVAGVTIDERAMVPHELGALVVEWSAPARVTLELRWECDLRFMWPYPAGVLGDLRWHHDAHTLAIRGTGDQDGICCHFTDPVEWQISDASGPGPRLEIRTRLALEPDQPVRFTVAATSSGSDELTATLAALRDPISLGRARAAVLRRMDQEGLAIDSPEPELARALGWARHRLDSYIVATPGVGRSLVAGYAPTGAGWRDGRPGHAWYFGRDAVWTALASLAVGDFPAARDVIRFLGEKQDITGKILHECSTSGLVHYDAADATPLYLLLVARLHAWTGETAFLASEWDRVKRALHFCLTTDTDGDGLIENTGVGHGWIESGPLGGGTLTYYNSGVWAAALRELEHTARDLGDRMVASDLEDHAKRARVALEARFFDEESGRYALRASRAQDDWRLDTTPSATHAVPLLLDVADPARAASWLDDVAGSDFSTPWGVRLIPASDPHYDPAAPHGGAVWPLLTGWVSWAEYAAGREASAYAHMLANVRLMHEGAKGAWQEVLHGTTGRAAGVCPDRAWSAAMVVAPLVHGMLGAEPDAFRGRLRLRPQLPAAWDRCEFRNLRVGDVSLTLRFERHHEHLVFRVEQVHGAAPLTVLLEPVVAARTVRAARVDGVPARLTVRPFGGRLLVPVQLVLDAERVLEVEIEPA
ncbi:MAG TPA: GH116 family glycosyl hydrolase [Longimicrobiales bacterium]|nr:GH116 family glycosyl hydrolase [Longimicrobiales bacterium]